ncbi:hypothetical protein MMC14_003116 [Varicellaria rhodocarpa]|nr:hypothetical protein [Varicellaria rhodocarpa]
MFATWPSMYDPVKSLLNAPDETEAEKLTERWMKAKLKELNYVGLTAALISGVVIGSFSTYSAPSDPWTTHALWLSALLLALTSISIATQQSIGLNRLSSNENGLYKIRRLLGEDNPRYHPYDRGLYVSDNEQSKEPRVRIRKSQLWIWQTPVMLLNFALLLYIIGLMTAVFSRAVAARGDWSDGNIKAGP